MGLFSRFKKPVTKLSTTPPASSTQGSQDAHHPTAPDFGGGRKSLPRFAQAGYTSAFSFLPKRIQRDLVLDEKRFANMSISQMMDALIDAHPDVSFAVWNFLRVANQGYDIHVYKLNSDKKSEVCEREINEMLKGFAMPNVTTFEKSRDLDKVINQLVLSVLTRGAAACELVLTEDLKDIAFIAPVDPATIIFRLEDDRYVPLQGNGTLPINIPTFFYEGLDERIDDPYGRSPLISGMAMILFQIQVLNDIKAAVHNQGYPRLDIKIVEEVLLARMPINIRNNEQEKQKWLSERLGEIVGAYASLDPDDAFVHFDSVEIGTAGGGGGAMIDPEKLMNAIDNLIMSGLKVLSTILGRRSSSQTESYAKLEIKLFLMGAKAITDIVSKVLSRALTLALNIKGKQGIVEVEFRPADFRTTMEMEQFKAVLLQNLSFSRDQGWISQEQCAQMAYNQAPMADAPIVNDDRTNKDGEVIKPTPDNNPRSGGRSAPTPPPKTKT